MGSAETLQGRLEKIRSSPDLQNQQQTRVVLLAVEDTLQGQNSEFTPTAYFAALLSLLGQHISGTGSQNSEVGNAVVYLLDLVTPSVPVPLLKSKFVSILNILGPALSNADVDSALLRASIGTLVSLLVAQDAKAWTLPQNQAGARQALAGLLKLALDPRPKVRKRAQDGIASVLEHRPASPSLDHPAADLCAETALLSIQEFAAGHESIGKQVNQSQGHDPALIHAMQLVKVIAKSAGGWPSRGLESLSQALFTVARSRNSFLTSTAFEVFETVIGGMAKDEESSEKLSHLLDAMTDMQPSQNDTQLLPPWIAVVARGYDVYAQVDEIETFQRLPEIFAKVSSFLASSLYEIRSSASECLVSLLVNCIPASIILEPSVMDEKVFEKLANTMNGLFDVKFQSAWMEVFGVLGAMLGNFRWHSVPLLNKAVQTVGELRASESFQEKEKADVVIASAVQYMGPENVLQILPLNLGVDSARRQGRAWLIPVIRDHVSNTSLAHFKTSFVPLSERLFQNVMDAGDKKTMETKIFETLVQQIWSCLPGYCDRPTDCANAFDQSMAEMISNLLYQQPQMRNDLCRALLNLVQGYKDIVQHEHEDSAELLVVNNRLTKELAQSHLDHLSKYAANMLAVLFNVYGETLPQHRAPLLAAINIYLSITPTAELAQTFERVTTTFETSFAEFSAKPDSKPMVKTAKPKTSLPPMTHALMDILVTMALYLPRESYQRLFIIASTITSQQREPQLQKKAYKLIPRLAQAEKGRDALRERSTELQALMLSNTDATLMPARKDRLAALVEVVKLLPNADLAFVPSILPEVIIRTKETNERARETAYGLIVHMGERMAKGGTIDNSRVPNSASDATATPASLDEYFTILSAGLAGSTPHMISASVTAISRALFSFYPSLSTGTLQGVVDTMSLFLDSPTREVVGSVLGFIKVAVITLNPDILSPRLPELIPRLIAWSHEHKANFRAKVKNILERMIRRFGIDVVERHCPEEDQKLITNIRKARERRKRLKKGGKTDENEEPTAEPKQRFSNEFDEAIYGSSDESEESDDGDRVSQAASRHRHEKRTAEHQRRRGTNEAYIHEAPDEPLDLLDKQAISRISSTRPRAAPQIAKKHGAKSKTDADGKLVFKDDDNDGEGDDAEMLDLESKADGRSLEKGIDAYVDAIRGKHAVARGQRGRLKVKNVRGQDEDVEMEDARRIPGRSNGGEKTPGRGEIRSPKRVGHMKGNGRGRGGGRGRVAKAEFGKGRPGRGR
ncbi:MAG: hypothetical protein Q9162_006654 [Coniocarpon cinnabarinum]